MNDTIIRGKYRIVREIARSNDIVYEAMDVTLNRRIALKELNIAAGMTGQAKRERIERFKREATAAGRLNHPNIVTVYDHWEENGRHFIAMEYLDGQTLRDLMQMRGALPLKEAIDIATQMLAALAHAHANKVIHRDIKPDNIFILPGGNVKLTDFGIARLSEEPALTSNGQVFGTPSYMSPEQIEGKHIDHRSDLFSLGVLLYEMLARRKPFVGDSVISITYAIMNAEPASLVGIPQGVEQVLRRALAKRPEQRQISADQMRQDLLYAEQTPAAFLPSFPPNGSQTGMNMGRTGMGGAYGNGTSYPNSGYPTSNPPNGYPNANYPPPNYANPNTGGMGQGMSGMGGYGGQNTGYGNTGAQPGTNYGGMNPMGGMTNLPALPDPQAGANVQPWAWNTTGSGLTKAQIKAMRRQAQAAASQGLTPQQLAAQYAQNGQNGQQSPYAMPNGAGGMMVPYAAPPFVARPREPLIVLSDTARSNLYALLAAVVIGCVLAFGIVIFMNRYQSYRGTVTSEKVRALMTQGSNAYNKQDYTGAVSFFEQALAGQPNATDLNNLKLELGYAYVQLARQARSRGSISEALSDYNKAIANAPDYQVAHTELSDLKASTSDVQGARAERDAAQTSTTTQQPPVSLQAPPPVSTAPAPSTPAVDPNQILKDKSAEAQRLISQGDQLIMSGDRNGALQKWRDARDAAPGLPEHNTAQARITQYEINE